MRTIFLLLCLMTCGRAVFAQTRTVTGTVRSKEGIPLPGVSITIKGSDHGGQTDSAGRFSIQASPRATLRFSFVGMEPVEVPLAGHSEIQVVLKKNNESLNDVIVIGYGSVKKKDLTGAVASIKSEELNSNSPLTLEQGLQGKMAGVNVVSNDGAPGGGMSIQIRGSNTFSGSGEPLYVVDGVPLNVSNSSSTPLEGTVADPNSYSKNQTNALAFLDPRDIETIQVLKDASATAIYGSRGANGVVIITTKGGRASQKPTVDVGVENALSHIIKFTDVMSGQQYTQYMNDVDYWTNYWKFYDPATGTSSYVPNPNKDFTYPGIFDYTQGMYLKGPKDYSPEKNVWQRAIMRTGVNQKYSIGVSGGSKNTTYALRYNHTGQKGIIRNSSFSRNGLNFNLNQKTFDWLSLGTNTNLSMVKYNLVNTASTADFGTMGLIKTAIYARPIDAEVPKSFLDQGGFYATSSPFAYISTPDYTDQIQAFTNLYGEITFLPSLKLRSNVGYQLNQNQRHKYYNRDLYEGRAVGAGGVTLYGYAEEGFTKNISTSFENTLTYDQHIDRHSLNLMGTLSTSKYEWSMNSMDVRGFGLDVTQGYDMSSATGVPRVWAGRGETSLMSFLGRFNYNYDERYYLTGSIRRDGASNFAANNKWATFYSFAAAYNLAREKFLQHVSWIDLLKIRGSYGYTGNQGIGAYASLAQYVAANYPFEGIIYNGYIISGTKPGNANLKWETTKQVDVGLDVTLFKSRLNFTMDYYHKHTYDLLQYKAVAMSTGIQTQPMNVGAVENHGIELSLSGTPIRRADFSWEVSANWSANRNKILRFGENADAQDVYGPYRLEGLILKQGHPIGQLYGYEEQGFWNSIDEYKNSDYYKTIQQNNPSQLPTDAVIAQNYLGEIRYKDRNHDGVLNEKDRTMIGNVNPSFIYGVTNKFDYKNFSLGVFFQGVQGNDILNAMLLDYNGTSTWANGPAGLMDNAWTPERSIKNPGIIKYPKLGQNLSRNIRFSRRYVEDGSYLRLKNINLSYRIDRLFNIKDVKRITLAFSVNNVMTVTKYSGFDPEVNSAGTGNASWRGIDVGAYPYARTFIFSLQAQF
ncbi:MAG: TonB-dependent receptor [Chitinophagaceae bacterium]|nr:TonB-dependent receptor [Chitinophagaceae bacterium]